MNLTAIGHYTPFITHQLVAMEKCPVVTKDMGPQDNLKNVFDSRTYCFGDSRTLPFMKNKATLKIIPFLSQCDEKGTCDEVAPGHVLKRGPLNAPGATLNPVPFRLPIMNIRTTKDIMDGHNDMWNPVMQSFLVQLMLHTVTEPGKSARVESVQTVDTLDASVQTSAPATNDRANVKAGDSGRSGSVTPLPDRSPQSSR